MTRGPLPVSVPSGCSYEILTPNAIPKGFMDGKQACEKMVYRGKGLCFGGRALWRDEALWFAPGPAQWVGPMAGNGAYRWGRC